MSARPRVMMIITNLGSGGAQNVFRQQMRYLSSYCDVTVCVFNKDNFLADDHSLNVISLDVPGGGNVVQKIINFLLRVARLRQLKKKYAVQICISHLEGADYVNFLSKRNERQIFWIHGSKEFDRNISGLLGWLRKKISIPFTYRRADLLVAVSDGIRTELLSRYQFDSSRIQTINNSFDLNAIQRAGEVPLDPGVEDLFNHPVMITHCRLAREKNIEGLLLLFKMTRRRTDLRLVILGDGLLRSELIARSKELDLRTFDAASDRFENDLLEFDVLFLGYQANPYRFLSHATLYVMTSRNEGFPLALCEAMACGLPVVSTDCFTGPREILDPENIEARPVQSVVHGEYGMLLPFMNGDNLDVISHEVASLCNDADLLKRYRSLAQERVAAFDSNVILPRTRDLVYKFQGLT